MNATVTKLLNPLKSRKVQTAIATLVVAYAAEWGFNLNDAQVLAIIGLGGTIVLGIAHEDNGAKAGAALLKSSGTPQPLQTLTAEPIAPAVGQAVKDAIEPLSKTLRQVLDERRKEANAQHTSTATAKTDSKVGPTTGSNGTGKNGTVPKPPAPSGP